jgi:hypothetical protein
MKVNNRDINCSPIREAPDRREALSKLPFPPVVDISHYQDKKLHKHVVQDIQPEVASKWSTHLDVIKSFQVNKYGAKA